MVTFASGDRRFEALEEEDRVKWLEACCKYTGKIPDELASCSNMGMERDVIATALREKGLLVLNNMEKLDMLNNF